MKISDINPFVRYANVHKIIYGQSFYSICYDCRIFYVRNCKGYITVNDEKYAMESDTVFYFPFGTKYRFNIENTDDIDIIVIDFDILNIYSEKNKSIGTATEFNFNNKELSVTDLPDEFTKIIVKKAPQLEPLLLNCANEFLNEKPFYKEIASSLIKQCLVYVLREDEYDNSSPLINDIIEYIEQNYNKPSLNNSEIADKFGYHQYYLSKIMKQSTGFSLKTYIIKYRIQMSKNLLLTTKSDINTIAWKCGFNSVPLFIKTFKDHTGVTPKKYRSKSFEIYL